MFESTVRTLDGETICGSHVSSAPGGAIEATRGRERIVILLVDRAEGARAGEFCLSLNCAIRAFNTRGRWIVIEIGVASDAIRARTWREDVRDAWRQLLTPWWARHAGPISEISRRQRVDVPGWTFCDICTFPIGGAVRTEYLERFIPHAVRPRGAVDAVAIESWRFRVRAVADLALTAICSRR